MKLYAGRFRTYFTMKILLPLLIFLNITVFQMTYAKDLHEHSEGHGHHDEHESATDITNSMAKQVGIVTDLSGPQILHQILTTYGRLVAAPEQTSHVRARFSGVITSVNATIGDTLKADDLLAVVESNQSLKRYSIRSPIDGVVVQRHANVGEVTQEQVLFSISNFNTLWTELRIFPTQRASVRSGQEVVVRVDGEQLYSSIEHVLPDLTGQSYLLARAKISNEALTLVPGLMIEGDIVTDEFKVPVAVENSALQTMESQIGVFVKHDEKYQFTSLTLGRKDNHYTEVISGLDSGVEYVTQSSYLIKADIEKSEAEHVH